MTADISQYLIIALPPSMVVLFIKICSKWKKDCSDIKKLFSKYIPIYSVQTDLDFSHFSNKIVDSMILTFTVGLNVNSVASIDLL